MKPAARLGDDVEHGSAMAGFIIGASLAALTAVAVVASGGLAVGPILAAAGGGLIGGGLGAGMAALINPTMTTGKIIEGSATVLINKRPASSVLDQSDCFIPILYPHNYQALAEGSAKVFIECRPAARVGDEFMCGGRVATGSANVLIGGGGSRVVGTRRTRFDKALNVGSAYLTAISFGLSPISTAVFAAAGTAVSRGMVVSGHDGDGSSIVGMLTEKTLSTVGVMLNYTDPLVKQFSIAVRPYSLLVRYQITKRAAGATPWPVRRYLNNFMVSSKNPNWKGPKVDVSRAQGLKLLGVSFLVDGVKIWRDIARNRKLPSKHDVCCDDQSWLEPS